MSCIKIINSFQNKTMMAQMKKLKTMSNIFSFRQIKNSKVFVDSFPNTEMINQVYKTFNKNKNKNKIQCKRVILNSQPKKITTAILDFSGTTLDSMVLAPAVVFMDVFKNHGVEITMAEARKPMGLRKDLHIEEILKDKNVNQRWYEIKGTKPNKSDAEKLFSDFVPMQLSVLKKYSTLLPNTKNVFDILKYDMDMKIGLTTGFTRKMVDVLQKEALAQGISFDSCVAGDDIQDGCGVRPKPFMLYQNLMNLDAYPIENVVKVDDTISGVGEGINAGCWTVGLYSHSNYMNIDSLEHLETISKTELAMKKLYSMNKLVESGAHYLAPDISYLPKICESINYKMSIGETPQSCNFQIRYR